ncbi:MAG: hypothetical protein NTU47_13750 [Ignavibacteriales bacterium]|nr:hypothetical protein [Ignavibacteriales bacterium]
MTFLRSTTLVGFLTVAAGICFAEDVPVLTPRDFPSGVIVKTEYYSGKALFGYIDGGAELYLEYKFQKLGRQEIRLRNELIVAEIYQMAGPYEAFGIFSIQRFKCIPVDSASPYTCQSRYQLQAVLGDCYLSIVNESGSTAAQRAAVEIFKSYKAKIKPQTIPLPSLFHSAILAKNLSKLTVICGTLGIQNGISEWEPLFQGVSRFSLTFLPIERGNDRLTIVHIRFPTARDESEFRRLSGFGDSPIGSIQSRQTGDTLRTIRRVNEVEVMLVESPVSFPDRESFVRLLAQ